MISSGVLKFTPEGRVLVTETPVGEVVFNGGTPVDSNGALVVDQIPDPLAYNGGLVYDAETTALGVVGAGGGGGGGLDNQALIDEVFLGASQGFCCELTVNAAFARGLLFQDAGGTIPAEVGMPVGFATDVSGKGNNLTLLTSAPTLRVDGSGNHYLQFLTGNGLQSPSIVFGSTGFLTVFSGFSSIAGSARYIVNKDAANVYSFSIQQNTSGSGGTITVLSRGGGTGQSVTGPAPSSTNFVITLISRLLEPYLNMRQNGVLRSPNTASQGATGYFQGPVAIGKAATGLNPFSGDMYAIPIVVVRTVEEILIQQVEEVIAIAMGFTPTQFSDGGIITEADGLVPITYTEPIAQYVAGLPLDAEGKLCVTSTTPPVISGFSTGFDEGF